MRNPFHPLFVVIAVAVVTLWTLGCGGYTITRVEDQEVVQGEDAAEVTEPASEPAPVVASPAPEAPPAPEPPAAVAPGQIQVTTGAAVQVLVDGVPAPFYTSQGFVVDLTAGRHVLEVMNLLGKIQARTEVDVPSGQRVRFTYQKKTLTETGTVAASAVPVADLVTVPAAPAEDPGSVQISGLSAHEGSVWVDGYQVGYSGITDSHLKGGLTPGSHTIRIESGGAVVYEGPIEVRSGENHRCLVALDGFDLDCHWTRPAL